MTPNQADREAALKLYGWRNEEQLIREGTTAERFEVDEATQAFAAHRGAERAGIVAWLRSDQGKGSEEGVDWASTFADALERGQI